MANLCSTQTLCHFEFCALRNMDSLISTRTTPLMYNLSVVVQSSLFCSLIFAIYRLKFISFIGDNRIDKHGYFLNERFHLTCNLQIQKNLSSSKNIQLFDNSAKILVKLNQELPTKQLEMLGSYITVATWPWPTPSKRNQ